MVVAIRGASKQSKQLYVGNLVHKNQYLYKPVLLNTSSHVYFIGKMHHTHR